MLAARKNSLRYFALMYVALFVMMAAFGYLAIDGGLGINYIYHSKSKNMASDLAYYDLPRITVSVGTQSSRLPPRLRADISLAVASKDMPYLAGYQPHITEKLSKFLSTVRPEQLELATELPQLRRDMLQVINSPGAPIPIHDLLFRELVVM